MLHITIRNNKPPHLCRNMQQFICIIHGESGRTYVGWYVDCKNRHGITKNKDKRVFCDQNILTEGVFVTQLPSNVRISVCGNVTTDCRSMSVYVFILTQIIKNILYTGRVPTDNLDSRSFSHCSQFLLPHLFVYGLDGKESQTTLNPNSTDLLGNPQLIGNPLIHTTSWR
jgi:predicted GIY-YIG superfamily endonuclease